MLDKIFKFFSSLKLTVACLVCGLILVFFGTLAQVEQGLYQAQANYFRSLFVYWTPGDSGLKIPVFPGGYLLGWVLLFNLLAAHYKRFKFTWAKFGIFLVHAGLILMLLGQFFTEMLQVETSVRLEEGQVKNYSESGRKAELVFIDRSNPDHDTVIAIPDTVLNSQTSIQDPKLPFTINVKRFFPNSSLKEYAPMMSTNKPAATQGIGAQVVAFEQPKTVKMDERNVPSALLEFEGADTPEGTWLASVYLDRPQPIEVNGKTYDMTMRFRRHYTPYSIQLLEFRHDRYIGTDIPKNFSSRVRLTNPETNEDREVLIYMNNPLRYDGATYYQASFERGREDVTILQVVRNPTWLAPYVSVVIISIGLIAQFMMHLWKFVNRRKQASAQPSTAS